MLTRTLYQALGFGFVALAVVGVFLPILPATPFLLVAAACFARSSRKWHAWLLSNQIFGPIISDWETNRCISWRIKLVAVVSMCLVGGYSIFFAIDHPTLKIIGGIGIVAGLFVISHIDTCRPPRP